MATQNHTPIDHIIQQHAAQTQPLPQKTPTPVSDVSSKPATVSVSPESAPIQVASIDSPQDNTSTEDTVDGADSNSVESLDSGLSEFSPLQESVEHTIQDEEVKEYVEERQENVQVPSDLQQSGVEPVQSTQFPAYQAVKLPITDEQVMAGLHQPKNSSFRWLAELAMYLLKKAHITLKTVHGHVVRVMSK